MIAPQGCLTYRVELLMALACLCFVFSSGCSKPDTEVTVCVRKNPPTADEAVRQVLAGLQRQELEELWEFLPRSYQRDVETLVENFGERLDERSWEPFGATCRKAKAVVSQIGRDAAASSQEASDSEKEWTTNLRSIEQLLDALCESRLMDVQHLRVFHARSFLSMTGNKMVAALSQGALGDAGLGADSFSRFGEVKVALTESSGDSALITVQWPGQDPTQHHFVCVEHRWIPQTLAEAWPTEFPKVREQVLAWADELRANPEPWHARLREIDQLLDELAVTKSLAETRQVWQAGASRLVVAWFGMTIPEPPKTEEIPVESPAPAKPVRVKKPDTEVLLPDEPQK